DLPRYDSPEEHAILVGSTPNSFSDIPPVIRHKEENVTISLDPPHEGFTNENALKGTLYVLTSVLVFMSNAGTGFQVEYPAITLHAVSRGEFGPSIYCQLDETFGVENGASTADDDAVTDMRELSIVPQNPGSLEAIFEALSQCASLHPDPQDDEDDLDDAFVDVNGSTFETFSGDEDQELSEVGRAALAHLESIIYDPHNLRSAEEEEEEEGLQENEIGVTKETNISLEKENTSKGT
ncbi:regulator of volume decrease after cellular swelling-domain-containing protein, partial [Gymnopilus junonius]